MFDTFGPNINIKNYDKTERSFWKNLEISFSYRIQVLINKCRVKMFGLLALPIPLKIRLFNIEMNNYQALWKYKVQSYNGDIHVIRAKMKPSGWYSDPLMGWAGTITGKVHTYEISGTHSDFIESPELCRVFSKLV